MPNTRSAAKRTRSSAKRQFHNRSVKSELKTLSKKLSAFSEGNLTEARELARELTSKYDKAVKMGVIPRGRADRRKSRIWVFVSKLAK